MISNCTNKVDIDYTAGGKYVGGISAYINIGHSFEMSNLENIANVSGNEYVGGIFGYITCYKYSSASVTLSQFKNAGTITATGSYVGGAIGYYTSSSGSSGDNFILYASEFDHTGEVWGGLYVGGWIGYGYSDSSSSIIQDSHATGEVQGTRWCGKYVGVVDNIQIDYVE